MLVGTITPAIIAAESLLFCCGSLGLEEAVAEIVTVRVADAGDAGMFCIEADAVGSINTEVPVIVSIFNLIQLNSAYPS